MVDIGFFRQSLPGPTLKFSMDLTSPSMDLSLAHNEGSVSVWQRPQGCQVMLIIGTAYWLLFHLSAIFSTQRESGCVKLLMLVDQYPPSSVAHRYVCGCCLSAVVSLHAFVWQVIFTDEQPLLADTLTIYSTPSDEEGSLPSVQASSEVLDASQQESVMPLSVCLSVCLSVPSDMLTWLVYAGANQHNW